MNRGIVGKKIIMISKKASIEPFMMEILTKIRIQ